MTVEQALPEDHYIMVAWNKWCASDEFKTALMWAVRTKYDDGREINPIQIE